jgi:outer membrane protein assembly factor BamB
MKKILFLSVFIAAAGSTVAQVDWPVYRGTVQRTGVQQREQILSTASLDQLELLWKRRLGEQALTAPAIVGRLITHHGFQELIFIANSAGDVFAIDDDLNRILWTRHLPQNAQSCGAGLTAAPVFPPLPHNAVDSDEDNPYAPRPVYVLSSDGRLYALNPMTGKDMSAPANFVPTNAKVSNLNYRDKVIYTTTSRGCGAPEAVWALDTATATVASYRATDGATVSDAGVTIGADGTVYAVLRNGTSDIVALNPKDLKVTDSYSVPGPTQLSGTAAFEWQGREVVAAYGDGLVLLDGKNVGEVQAVAADGLAVSKTLTGRLWLYAASRTGSIVAFTVEDNGNHPVLKRSWSSPLQASAAPVIANGIIYLLSAQSGHTALYALDALTGQQLYSSGSTVESPTLSAGLAVANGHICFGTQNGTLYCFGLPIDL